MNESSKFDYTRSNRVPRAEGLRPKYLKGENMNKIWVVTQQGIPIMAYNQSEVTPLELWEKHLGCSVFDVEVQ